MTEKSFLEILSEKIEQQVRSELSQSQTHSQTMSNNQSADQFSNEKNTQNVDNSREDDVPADVNSIVYNQWINQIPMGKVHFSTPKQQIFGRIYPINTPKPKPEAPRQKHVLSELQKQAMVYFWGWQIRLKEDFNEQELKKAFRTMAHRLHPDRNQGRTQQFLELKMNYQCLMSVFK